MIQQTNWSGSDPQPLRIRRTPAGALESLVQEITHGGGVVHDGYECVSVRRALHDERTDTTVFHGTSEKMEALVLCAQTCSRFSNSAFSRRNEHVLLQCMFERLCRTSIDDDAFFHRDDLMRELSALSPADQCAVIVMVLEHRSVPIRDLIALAA